MHNRKVSLLTTFAALVLVACGDVTSSLTPTTSSTQSSSNVVVPTATPANGLFSYAAASYTERAKIIGALEKYAQDNYMSGIPLYDSGGLVMYSNRLAIPSNVFIPNYGFGVGEGTILSPMTAEQEPVEAWRRYYHTWTNVNTGTLNALNSQTATVSEFYGNISGSYYTTKLNAAKDNYEWVNLLATAKPIALDRGADGLATKWKVPLRVDAELKYNTLSTDSVISTFNGRQVALEDYLTPFKLMLDNNWFRATDLGSTTSGFVGVSAYVAAKAQGLPADFSTVGIKLSSNENAIEFTFNQAKNDFYALYNLASTLFSPIPQAFIDAIGGPASYGVPSNAVNSTLSLGVYTIESWELSKQFVFKKNPLYIDRTSYNFAGFSYTFITGATAGTIAFNEFLNGKLDAVAIPAAELRNYKSDPRTRKTLGAAVFKLNLNATTPQRWEELFGVNGQLTQTPVSNYWNVKPIMSNKNFLDGLYFSIDRVALAESQGRNPAQAFLSDAYMADPELGLSYRNSEPGKAAYADRLPNTLGFNRELAKSLFKASIDELVAENKYVRGTQVNPTTITLKVHHQAEQRMNDEKPFYSSFIEDVFNEANPGFRLVLDHFFTAGDVFAPYDAMEVGQFDIAMGTISGSTLDPLSFMEILTSDNRTGFTLSWTGVDTSVVSPDLVYDNKQWSYNALYEAGMGAAVVTNGSPEVLFNIQAATASGPTATTYNLNASGLIYTASPGQIIINIVEAYVFVVTSRGPTGAITGRNFYDFELADVVVNQTTGTWSLSETSIPRLAGIEYYLIITYTYTIVGGRTSAPIDIVQRFNVPAAPSA
jgi:hypothetical protein